VTREGDRISLVAVDNKDMEKVQKNLFRRDDVKTVFDSGELSEHLKLIPVDKAARGQLF
jgi:hypothetical protein